MADADAAWWLARRKGLVANTAKDIARYGPDPGRMYEALGLRGRPVELARVDDSGAPAGLHDATRRRFAYRPDDGPPLGAWIRTRGGVDAWAAWLVLAEAALRRAGRRAPDEYVAVVTHLALAGWAGECEP